MKNFLFAAFVLLFVSLLACSDTKSNDAAATKSPTNADLVKRGAYLVQIMGCNDCHSPKKMGAQGPEIIPELMLSGYPADRPVVKFTDPKIKEGFGQFYPDLTAAAGPWGISFAANLTPDETGIGNWSEDQFKIALTKGKFKGMETGRMLLPPMPFVNYANMEDEDIKAVFAYLKGVKPVKNLVPAPVAPDKM
jgi:hypothetical protein